MMHAYMYVGGRHDEMLGAAKEFARANTTNSGDIIENEILTVDAVRSVITDLYLRPYGDKKVIIFPHADQMTLSAQNALLKALEEPPSYAVFILIAENEKNLLDTIISRVQKKRFSETAEIRKDRPEFEKLLDNYVGGKSPDAYRLIDYFMQNKDEKSELFIHAIEYFRRNLLNKSMIYVKIIEAFDKAERNLRLHNANYQMAITNAIIGGVF